MNILKHVGILGMRWGHRKGSSKNSSDHETLNKLRSKKLKDFTDDEIKLAVKRIRLIKQYKQSNLIKKAKISSLSNEELSSAVNKNNLKKAVLKENFFTGITKLKSIGQMPDAQVKAALNRLTLEKSYKDLTKQDYKQVEKLLNALLMEAVSAEVARSKQPK